jgi:hypothetical protein
MLCLSHGSITKKPALRNLWHQQDIIVHALATEFAGSLNWQRAKLQFLGQLCLRGTNVPTG